MNRIKRYYGKAVHLGQLAHLHTVQRLRWFMQDECGATAAEYALILAGIAVAIITVVGTLGSSISAKFNEAATAIGGGTP